MAITPNTVVRLLSYVPLQPNYDHVRDFSSLQAQTDYFIGKTIKTYTDFTYQRQEEVIKVPTNIDSLQMSNYLMYQNSEYSSKWFYGFITGMEYVNPNTTAIYFQVDVYQTWLFDFSFKPSYVIREHTLRWNTDGTPIINTVEEGLNYGTDYETVDVKKFVPYDDLFFLVIVAKQAIHSITETSKIKATINGLPQPLNYYIHPFKLDGTMPGVSVGGTAVTMSPILSAIQGVFKQLESVDNIVSMYVTEFFDTVAYDKTANTLSLSSDIFESVRVVDNENETVETLHLKELKAYKTLVSNFGNKYDGYHTVSESKLLMHPYTALVLDDFKGNRIEIKNEYIGDDILTLRTKGSLGTSNKVSYQVENYLIDDSLLSDQQIGMENSVINNNPNDLPILSDMLSAYLQGNRNTIENNKASAMFNALTTTLGGALGGAIGGGRLGVLGGIGGAGVGAVQSYYQIESFNAKEKDIRNMPPNMVSMGGNTYFDYGNNVAGVYLIKKQITGEYRKRLGDYFKMFGYRVNELKIPNTNTRQHFNFVHTVDCHIFGNIPHNQLQELKSIFDKGVTIWHGDYVGDYSLANNEV